ncbi:hypothetical protein ACPUEN_11730 [Algoriphagus yeomjeoni]|uniref:hypothetical protein n=1 Tax=Algoriphagus yeomjeoni TaxID=291403 RepID=UPI003CE4CFA4
MTALFIKIAQIPVFQLVEFHVFMNITAKKNLNLTPSWEIINDTFISEIDFKIFEKCSVLDPLHFFEYNLIRSISSNDQLASGFILEAKKRLEKQFEELKNNHKSNCETDPLCFVDEFGGTNNQFVRLFFKKIEEKFKMGELESLLDVFLVYNYFNLDKLVFIPTKRDYVGFKYSLSGDLLFDEEVANLRYQDVKRMSAFVIKENKIESIVSPFQLKQNSIKVINSFRQIEVEKKMLVRAKLGDLLKFSPSYHFFLERKYDNPYLELKSFIREIDIFSYFARIPGPPLPPIPGFKAEKRDSTPVKYLKTEFSHLGEKFIRNTFLEYLQNLKVKLEAESNKNIYQSTLELEIPFYEISRIVSIQTERKLKIEHDKEVENSKREWDHDFEDDFDFAKDGLDDLNSADPDWYWNID